MPLDHEMRRSGIPSSRAGQALGVVHDRDLHGLWAEYVGGLIPPPATFNMRLGTALERFVIEIYGEYIAGLEAYKGKTVEPLFDKTFRHPQFPHVLATPDGLVGSDGGVDAKTASWYARHQWGETADDMPNNAQIQLAICMEVFNRNFWDVALLSGDQFRVIRMERDREFGLYICTELERIWQEYFTTKDNPPPIGGSKASAAWLKQAYPRNRIDLRVATDEEIRQLRLYGQLRADQAVLKKERERLENWLKNAVKDSDGLIWETGKFTWKRANDSNEVDWHSLAETLLTRHVRLPDNSARDEEAIKELKAMHSKKTPGVRRIYYKSDEAGDEEASNAA